MINVPKIFGSSEIVQFNLDELILALGEDEVKSILSSFSCPLNKDVENFIKNSAIPFSKASNAKTFLIFWKSDNTREFVGYYTVAIKSISIYPKNISKTTAKKLRANGHFDREHDVYRLWAPLIAQLGKNYASGNDTLIAGHDILEMAIERARALQLSFGGKIVYLECEDHPKLIDFYTKSNFKIFGKRKLDRDETGINGDYLLQLFTIL